MPLTPQEQSVRYPGQAQMNPMYGTFQSGPYSVTADQNSITSSIANASDGNRAEEGKVYQTSFKGVLSPDFYLYKNGQFQKINVDVSGIQRQLQAINNLLQGQSMTNQDLIAAGLAKADPSKQMGIDFSPLGLTGGEANIQGLIATKVQEKQAALQRQMSSQVAQQAGVSSIGTIDPNLVTIASNVAVNRGLSAQVPTVDIGQVQSVLSAPTQTPQYDPNNQFYQRAQGTLPQQQPIGEASIATTPQVPGVQGTTQIATTQTPMQSSNIPFREGLTDAQKQSIQNLIQRKPDSLTWSNTDKANWNYATNSANAPSNITGTYYGNVVDELQQPLAGAAMPSQINFKPGLSQTQQDSITSLVQRKPDSSTWTDTDKANWAYATNNAPLPADKGTIKLALEDGSSGNTGNTTAGTFLSESDLSDQTKLAEKLQTLGYDVANLSASDLTQIGAAELAMETSNARFQNVAPPTNSAADWSTFMSQASQQLDPYYKDLFNQARQDLTQNVGYLTGEYQQLEQTSAQQYQEAMKAQAEQYAAAGLARSGLRQEAEQKLQGQQQGLVSSNRRNLQNQLYDLGSSFERAYGTSGLAQAGVPAVTSQAYPTLGVNQSTLGYAPLGIASGTMGQERTANEILKAQELAQQKTGLSYQQSSYGQYMPGIYKSST